MYIYIYIYTHTLCIIYIYTCIYIYIYRYVCLFAWPSSPGKLRTYGRYDYILYNIMQYNMIWYTIIHIYIYIYRQVVTTQPAHLGWPSSPGKLCTPCGDEVWHGVTSGVSRKTCTKNRQRRWGATWCYIGVSCETSKTLNETPHLYREYREMRGFAGRERQPRSGALGAANQQPAS